MAATCSKNLTNKRTVFTLVDFSFLHRLKWSLQVAQLSQRPRCRVG